MKLELDVNEALIDLLDAVETAIKAGDWKVDGACDPDLAIRRAKQSLAQPEQEPMAWRNAAIRVGEDLSSVGPHGYYDMTAQQWIDWAMEQEPKGKTSLPQPKHEWVGLTNEEINEVLGSDIQDEPSGLLEFVRAIEAKLKEKNT